MKRTGRFSGDTWDLASSVGATATMVAAGRAIASRSASRLIDDPFAEPLVRAVGIDLFTRLATGELDVAELGEAVSGGAGDDGAAQDSPMTMARMADNMAVRTRYFDDFFLDAGKDAGIRQVVILASGLDARAYRLAWPTGTTVYEIDQPDVIEFKTRTLVDLGVRPTADRRPVAVDLRDNWPAALRAAGFDPTQPTAWSAEGLLAYLPSDAQDRLLDTVTELSAPGSRFATESAPTPELSDQDTMRDQMQAAADRMRGYGVDLDMTELIYFGDRNEAGQYLSDRGWQITSSNVNELFVTHGLAPIDVDSSFSNFCYVSAVLAERG